MYQQEYLSKRLSASDAMERVHSGDTVFISGNTLTPVDFLAALPQLNGRAHGVRILNYLPMAPFPVPEDPACADTFHIESAFYNQHNRSIEPAGFSSLTPAHLRNMPRDWVDNGNEIDLMVFAVSPMDQHGYFTLSCCASMEWEMMRKAKSIIVEVASHAPRTFGDTLVHISQVDGVIESDRYPPEVPVFKPDEADIALGRYVADLVEDGSTIQLGFGATVAALASELKHKRGLGIHTEFFSNPALELIQCGAADNLNKSLDQRFTVTSFSTGTRDLYDFINDNPSVLHKRLTYTNDLTVLSQCRKMVSINATLQIDLSGQCASESIGSRQYSGAGGQVDTAVGAQMSPGGKSIITLRSTYYHRDPITGQRELRSRIVPVLSTGAAVTLTRTNTHYVATEYGVVCLRGLSIKERCKALISIAHPDFRPWLEEESSRYWR